MSSQTNKLYLAALVLLLITGCSHLSRLNEVDKRRNYAIQQCLSEIDAKEIARLSEQSKAFEAEIDALCKAGARDLAQSRALIYSQQMVADPILQAMQQCGKDISVLLPINVDEPDVSAVGRKDKSKYAACDDQPQPQRWRQFTVWP